MDRDSRRLARIERSLVADDPVLGEAFVLWHQRCSTATTAPDDRVPAWVLAVVLLVLPAWVLGVYAAILVAGLGGAWLVFALDDGGRPVAPPPDGGERGPWWQPHPSGWWT